MKVLLLLIFPFYAFTQDITGVWMGYLKTPGSQLTYEVAISEQNKKLSGYSMIIFVNADGIENTGIKTAKIKLKKNELSLEDEKLIYDNFTSSPQRSKLYATLLLNTKGSIMTLTGTFETRSLDFRDSRTYSGEIFLQKQNVQLTSKMLPKLEELNLLHTLSFLNLVAKNKPSLNKPVTDSINEKKTTSTKSPVAKPRIAPRQTEKIRDIFFSADSLVISLVDNGTVDGDTVSLLMNGKIILDKIGLTSKAFKTTIPVIARPGDSLQLVMYAENLGSIPPNTGLLTIEDGNNRYDIRFEGNLQKNSAIMLKKKAQ